MAGVESGTRVVAASGGEYVTAQEEIKDSAGNVLHNPGDILQNWIL